MLNTSKRNEVKLSSPGKKPIIARLSIIVAPNKRGDIIVRDGQDDENGLNLLVRNFVICYGLKKDMFPVILESLKNLLERNRGNYLTLNDNGDIDIYEKRYKAYEPTPDFNSNNLINNNVVDEPENHQTHNSSKG